ncbi:F-actin-capping protein subunit alpha [Boothiomyces sp. JEL0866]|nr:F-actin-capping protein subunit alpha [Boothiomyces sp. JEL0866]
MESRLASLIERLEATAARLDIIANGGKASTPAGNAAANEASSPSVAALDAIISGSLQSFITQSKPIGELVEKQVKEVLHAFEAVRKIVAIAAASKKPDDKTLQEIIAPLQKAIMAVTEIKDKNRPSPLFYHLSAIADGIPALGWVVVAPTPAPYIGEMKDAAQFYANRVIKDNKEKEPTHVEWVNNYLAILVELQAYVKQWHTTGLAWNPKGGDAKSANIGGAAPASAPAGGAPPPPPAPTAAQLEAFSTPSKPAAPNPADLLGELSKGTSGLRKVDKSEMTHKNPELRAGSVVKATEKPGNLDSKVVASAPKGNSAPKGPPKLALEGNKWVVENYNGNNEIVIDQTEIKHTVYIYNCQNSTIKVIGKVNAISLDNCKKVGLLAENIVATLDVVNCQRLQLQITGRCPTAVVDKTDGFQLYLSKDCLDIEILSAKSSEMNILIPTENGEFTEKPVSEQFKTVIKNGELESEAVKHKE